MRDISFLPVRIIDVIRRKKVAILSRFVGRMPVFSEHARAVGQRHLHKRVLDIAPESIDRLYAFGAVVELSGAEGHVVVDTRRDEIFTIGAAIAPKGISEQA